MTDIEFIKMHGGPSEFARKLGFSNPGATQRVSNWVRRGIPAKIKLDFPELFIAAKKFSKEAC